MAEILIRVRDKEGHNPLLPGEHEVVVVCPDGWGWSHLELSNPDWRVVLLPGMSVSEARRWESPENVDPEVFVRRRRHFKLTPEQLSSSDQLWYADDSRSEPARIIDQYQWEKAWRTRKPMRRRDVVGEPRVKDIGSGND